MSISCVLEALEASVTWRLPAVKRATRYESTVPNRTCPEVTPDQISGSFFAIQRSFDDEKYGSRPRPVFLRTSSSTPELRMSRTRFDDRRSCQTIAFLGERRVSLSQRTIVSRWFVMPRAVGVVPAASTACFADFRVACQISSGSCSTQPERGKCWGNSVWLLEMI